MLHRLFQLIAAASFALPLATPTSAMAADAVPAPKRYIYVLHLVPRLHDAKAWTDADNATVNAHFQRLQAAAKAGKVILAGRTDEPPAETFGIVVFEAAGDADAQSFMQDDPTVAGGIMTATLHPFSLALQRP